MLRKTSQLRNFFPRLSVFIMHLINILGPTGFDRMCGYVYKHAGAWDARLDH